MHKASAHVCSPSGSLECCAAETLKHRDLRATALGMHVHSAGCANIVTVPSEESRRTKIQERLPSERGEILRVKNGRIVDNVLPSISDRSYTE